MADNDVENCEVFWDGDSDTYTPVFSGANAAENRQTYSAHKGKSIHAALKNSGWQQTKFMPHKEGSSTYYSRGAAASTGQTAISGAGNTGNAPANVRMWVVMGILVAIAILGVVVFILQSSIPQ